MDRATECILIPQISNESFANAVVDIVKTLNQQASAAYAQHCLEVAIPDGDKSEMNQIDDVVFRRLCTSSRLCIQDEYLGQEWSEIILSDIIRYSESERMTEQSFEGLRAIVTNTSEDATYCSDSKPDELSMQNSKIRISWLEPDSISADYPALFEAIKCLHALPFEINGI